MKNVLFNTCSFSFVCPGGGEVQLLKSKEALENINYNVELYDPWNPQLQNHDLVHFFTVQQGMSSFCEFIKSQDKLLALSPIFWPRSEALRGEMWEIEKMLNLADIIFPNSMTEAKVLSDLFEIPLDKFHVTHNGIDPAIFKYDVDYNKILEDNGIKKPFYLCIGNIEARKNQLSILRALQEINDTTTFICVGNIREREYFEECSKINNFKYIPPIKQESQLFAALSKATKLFILASTCETPGLAALEVASFGAQIVLTEVGSTKEYFQNMVTYVDPFSISDIANGIKKELSLKRDQSLKEHVLKNFMWAKVAEQIDTGYTKIRKNNV